MGMIVHFDSQSPLLDIPPPDAANDVSIDAPARIVIQGITRTGRAFRPSDWAERLCGVMSTFGGDQQMRYSPYSPYVRPMMMDGVRCVIVEPALMEIEPRAYRFLLDFANDNELTVIDPRSPSTGDFCPVPGALDGLRG